MAISKPQAAVYIDGLNLYKQAIQKHSELKWLNPVKLAEVLLPEYEVKIVNYFTARVRDGGMDSQKSARQFAYLQALAAIGDRIAIYFGRMLVTDKVYPVSPLQFDLTGNLELVKVRVIQEKGSDVALASRMILDASREFADAYVLISNDSDYEPTLRILRAELQVNVGVLCPSPIPSGSLKSARPNFLRIIRKSHLVKSQLPERIVTSKGQLVRPELWVKKTNPPEI